MQIKKVERKKNETDENIVVPQTCNVLVRWLESRSLKFAWSHRKCLQILQLTT